MSLRPFVVALALLTVASPGCKKKEKKEDPAPAQPAQQAPAPGAAAPAAPAQPVGVNAGAFSIERTTFTRGEPIVVTFNRDMTTPPGQQHWITLTKPTDVESAWGVWHYVPQSAKTDKVVPPTAGQWEIRLHDVYPRYASRVIARQVITVN
jgi:hypothetical protein